ncbi:ABC transporter substrate-binding protein (plasmid) [Pacificitalea manganoxidans]|uniref:ABC transporter substrate-binding protein n=1 Tax=Pacificitalea manganoxidans TaxID=1411902 RepID=A0A291M558_9RHOB|nr:PotD/PotF family extracellular solute-binding protein [Pacificitalea manganoxidans]ATI43977.1 ABC transporter substrate-binding protein [Pacificitalea manganoxidans]MDR6310281.1 putative spermidine/putrescine transport system substrate-binding protein [Pacificitalea manganoxidans]
MTKKYSRRSVLRTGLATSGAALLTALPAGRLLAQEPEKPSEIIVRAWGGEWVESLKNGVSDRFTEMTGIAVRHDLTEDNEIQPKVWAAVAQGRVPPIHINWDTTTNATKSALRGVTEDIADLPNLANTTDLAKPVGLEGFPLVNTYGYVYVLAYRPEAFPDGPPASWRDLLDPKFKGRIALYNDGIGFHFPAQVAGGGSLEDIPENMEACWDFVREMKAQNPLLGEDPDFTTWFQNGEIDAACTISTNALAAKKNGVELAWTVPEEGCKFDTDCLWIPKGLPENELYWAKQYINLALSQESQQIWLDGLGLPGVVPGLTPPEGLAGDPSYPTEPVDFENLIRVSSAVQVQHESDWFAKFKEIMQG